MADAKPYLPGMPSLTSGVTPVNDSVGKEFRTLAADIGQVRQMVGETARSRYQAILGPLGAQAPYIGHAIGRLMHQNKVAAAAQTKMLGDYKVAQKLYETQRQLSDAAETMQQNFIDDPAKAGPVFKAYAQDIADQVSNQLMEDPQFKNMPQFAFQLREKLFTVQNSEVEKLSNWSRTQQSSNAKKTLTNSLQSERDNIATKDGSIEERYKTFVESKDRIKTLAANQAHILGQEQVSKEVNDHTLKAGVAFFHNLASTMPDDPEQAVAYSKQIGKMLDLNDTLGIPLSAHDKLQLHTMVNTMIGQHERDLVDHLMVSDLQDSVKVDSYHSAIKNSYQNAPVQLQAIQFADQQTHVLEQQAIQKMKDPNLSDKSRNAYTKLIDVKINRLRTLADTARGNLKDIETGKKQEQREHLQELKATARELKADAKEAKLEAVEAHKAVESEATNQAFDMRQEMYELIQSPDKNHDAILQRGPEIIAQIRQWRDQKILNDRQANADIKEITNMVTQAQTFKRKAPLTFGSFTFPIAGNNPVKKQSFDKTMNDREAAARSMAASGAALRSANVQVQKNQMGGLTSPAQIDAFHKAEEFTRVKAAAEGWTSYQVEKRLDAIRQNIVQTIKAPAAPSKPAARPVVKPAAKGKPGDTMVPPPPPLTPTSLPVRRITKAEARAMGFEIAD